MILKYEKACKKAELNKEQTPDQTKKIRTYLDNQKKKLREEKKSREKKGIVFCSWEKITETGDYQDYNCEDMDEMVGNKIDIEKLREEDRRWLCGCNIIILAKQIDWEDPSLIRTLSESMEELEQELRNKKEELDGKGLK